MDVAKRPSGITSLAFFASGLTVVTSSFVPWRTVYSCFTTIDECSVAPRAANWTIWQVGGSFGNNAQGIANFWNPSTFTWWGVVILAAGGALMIAAAATLLPGRTRGVARTIVLAVASSGAIAAAVVGVLLPAPYVSAATAHFFGPGIWTTRGPGTWICLAGALIGLIGVLAALHPTAGVNVAGVTTSTRPRRFRSSALAKS